MISPYFITNKADNSSGHRNLISMHSLDMYSIGWHMDITIKFLVRFLLSVSVQQIWDKHEQSYLKLITKEHNL